MTLTTQQQILIEQRVTNEAKSTGAAYLIWFLLGGLGVHRFYLGRTGSGIAQLMLFIFGWITLPIFVGAFLLITLAIWVLIDAFLIPGMVQSHKEEVRRGLTSSALIMSSS
ncbi:TM2 domain-containing protein [Mesorhizobium sp. M0296]|uniref:TM2 domain-containing protein n=1 Tax=Mesorhizobium sp. M0296 TaxID=2956931 RepID=UPI0033365A1C